MRTARSIPNSTRASRVRNALAGATSSSWCVFGHRGRRRSLMVGVVALLLVISVVAGCSSRSTGDSVRIPLQRPPAASLCGTASGPPATFAHVIVIVLENHSYDQLIGPRGSAVATQQTPYLNELATRCGLATNYHSITHPSLPNYLAITGGSTFGIVTDCTGCQTSGQSIFSELDAKGQSWAVYAEAMSRPCQAYDDLAVHYTVHHNPPPFYRRLDSTCAGSDLPLGTPTHGALATALRTGSLARYVFIAPDRCHDMHDCPPRTGDAWVAWWVNAITRSRIYQTQPTVIFITVDEGTGGHIGKGENCAANPTDQSCHVPLIVISRYTPRGARDRQPLDHYALMRATAQLLGVEPINNAKTAPNLRNAFDLG